MSIPHRPLQIENPRRTPLVKQILHHQDVHFRRLARDGVLGADLIEPEDLGEDGGEFVEEGLRHVFKVRRRKLYKRIHFVPRHLLHHQSVIYDQPRYNGGPDPGF